MLLNVVLKKRNVAALVAACSMLCSAADADLFVAFAGKYPAQVLNIESAQIVYLEADIWTGSARRFRVTLPGIAVPEDTRDAPVCQRELAAKAMTVTQDFLANAEKIEVHDIKMENSGSEEAIAPIFTDKGGLGEALIAEGLARPDSVDPSEPWCAD